MTTWFTSDLHFGHKNIIKYCKRPWATTAEMDAALISNWNAVVNPDDVVWNLGDLAFCCTPGHAYVCLKKLNGKKRFVRGNHDELAWATHIGGSPLLSPFREWHDGYVEIEVEAQKIVLCHYAMRVWHHALRGVWHLFGHTHGVLRPFGKSVDVGVDNTAEVLNGEPWVLDKGATSEQDGNYRRRYHYRPVSFAELKLFMDTRPVGSHAEFENFTPQKEQ